MKFRIIWIDDSRNWVDSVENDVKSSFEDSQFNPEINLYEAVDEARVKISESYIDLLIIDFNLPNGVTGDQFIVELRKNRCFAHVIFYSQDSSKLVLLTEDKHFIHVTSRDDFHETVQSVAEQAYRRYRHPAFMRGLLLSEFIDLENSMEDFIGQFFWDQYEFFKKSIIHEGGEGFSLAAKFKFIRRMLNKASELNDNLKGKIDEINFTQGKFQEKIIKRRNILAHAHPDYNELAQNIVLVSAVEDVSFNSDWFHETREAIHEFKLKVRGLKSLSLRDIVNPKL